MVYIIIPNYNGIHHLEVCITSLYRQSYKEFEIIVVDNASSDKSVDFLCQNYPGIKIIILDSNFGFSKAANTGIQFAIKDINCSHILLLNNDIECDYRFLEELTSAFKYEFVGSVAPKMLNFFNRDIIDDTGNFIKKRGYPLMRGHDEKDVGKYDTEEFIFGACAGAAMYKREVFERVGFFDEDFFAYLEDVDFSFRMQFQGYKCLYNPKAICYHKRGGTIKSNKSYQIFLLERNLVFLRIKNYPLSILINYSIYYQLSRIYRNLRYLFKSPSYFINSVWGYTCSLLMIRKTIKKRKKIYNSKKVSLKYIIDIMS